MHFEFLLEDKSSKKAMDILIPKILSTGATYRTKQYGSLGHLPKDLKPKTGAKKQPLLNSLPALLAGYGRTPGYDVIVIICDLDNRTKSDFLNELNNVLNTCNKKPNALFCIAVKEFEAWYLGDLSAIQKAYPSAKAQVLSNYDESICGTWELLADVVHKGGSKSLKKKGVQAVGLQKSIWAEKISPHMCVTNNLSPSFNFMHEQLKNALD